MKTLLLLSVRTVVILLAALLVVGVTMSVVDTSATNRFPGEGRGEFTESDSGGAAAQPTNGAVQGVEGRPPRGERHGPREQSLGGRLAFGLFGLVKNSAIIGVVVLIILGVERFFIRRPHNVAT